MTASYPTTAAPFTAPGAPGSPRSTAPTERNTIVELQTELAAVEADLIAGRGASASLTARLAVISAAIVTAQAAAASDATAKDVVVAANARRGIRIGAIGDSIVAGGSTAIGIAGSAIESTAQLDWLAWAVASLGGRCHYVKNAGIPSNTTTQMLARFTTDVLAYDLDVVIIGGGTNDAGNGTTLATYAANTRAMVDAARGAGLTVILPTACPTDTSGTWRANVEKFNVWLRRYAADERIPVIDFHSLLVEPTTGGWRTAYTADGIHPNITAVSLMGTLAAATLTKVLPDWRPPLATFQTADHPNLQTNGLLLTDTNSDGLPDGWSKTAGCTSTLVTPSAPALGKALHLVETATGSRFAGTTAITTGWSVGDRVAFCGRVNAVMGTTVGTWTVQLQFNSGTPNSLRPFSAWSCDVTDHVFYREGVIPAGTVSLSIFVGRNITTAGNGWSELVQPTILNLTTMGILAV